MIIESKAPTRIDLAGGTVDIWPIYLLMGPAHTINLGINLFAQATLTIAPPPAEHDAGVVIESQDQNAEIRLPWSQFEAQVEKLPAGLILSGKLISYFAQLKRQSTAGLDTLMDIRLKTSAQSPAGAGLGGSSTLAIATLGALSTWLNGNPPDPVQEGQKLIEIARDIETTLIQVPAGLQDYYGAVYGGLQKLSWEVAQNRQAYLSPSLLPELQKRILLFYSGQSRNSGINNWVLFKAIIDKNAEIQSRFKGIAQATQALEQALLSKNWNQVNQAIAAEWDARRGLATGISSTEMDQAFRLAAQSGCAGKICGAGGGGCFFIFEPSGEPEKLESLQNQITSIPGVRALPFQVVPQGLQTRTSP